MMIAWPDGVRCFAALPMTRLWSSAGSVAATAEVITVGQQSSFVSRTA